MYSIIEKKPIFRWRRGWIGSQGVENLKNLVEDKEIFLADKEVFNTMKTYFTLKTEQNVNYANADQLLHD